MESEVIDLLTRMAQAFERMADALTQIAADEVGEPEEAAPGRYMSGSRIE